MRTELVWTPDVLGDPYEAATIPLAADDEGEVVATLVRRRAASSTGRAVLYVHGFCDYFFQTELAEFWNAEGYDFYGLDLRKYGRSLREGQTPNFVTSLEQHYEELDAAWEHLTSEHDTVIVTAHSTGGLTVPLWLADRGHTPAAVVLNSPWLQMMGSGPSLAIQTGGVRLLGPRRPKGTIPRNVPGFYARSIHKDSGGEWDFDLDWKPLDSFPVRFGWVNAVRLGHARIAAGIDVQAPILVLASAASSAPKAQDDPHVMSTDIVIDARQTRARATKLGKRVTMIAIDGALHDVVLSRKAVRERAYAEIKQWLLAYGPDSLSQ